MALTETTEFTESNRRSGKNGSVLIVVLWVIGLLSIFVMAFAFDMHIETRIVSTWRKMLKAEYLSQAGIELARMSLLSMTDEGVGNPETSGYLTEGSDTERRSATVALAQGSGAELTRTLGEGTITVHIRPENSRIDLNSITANDIKNDMKSEAVLKIWDSIFEASGVPLEQRDALLDCLRDWVDQEDELSHLNGAESDYYETLDPPYEAKNGPFDTVEELALVKGFNELIPDTSQTVYEAVGRFLTTYGATKINVNAADAETLMAMFGIDQQMAEEIILQRNGPDGLPGTEDDQPYIEADKPALQALGLNGDNIAFKDQSYFYIQSSGKVGDVERVTACVVRLEDKNLTVLRWIEGDSSASTELITR